MRKQTTQEFSHNNGTTSDPELIYLIHLMNIIFNIGESLADEIPEAPLFDVYLNNPSKTAFFFSACY